MPHLGEYPPRIPTGALTGGDYEPVIIPGSGGQYWAGDKTWQSFPTSLPASDVSAWAKAPTKPMYTHTEVGAAATNHGHAISDITDLQTTLNGKQTALNGSGFVKASGTTITYDNNTYSLGSHNHSGVYEPVLGNPGTSGHVLSSTTAGVRSWVAPGGGSDPWTYVKLTSDFTTSSATAVDVTGLFFTPQVSSQYEVEGQFLLRTATATVGPRPGIAWPSSCVDGVATLWTTSSATAQLVANGNIVASVLTAVGGLPATTSSYPGQIQATFITGAGTSGNFRIQLASETAGTVVTMKAGSFIKYRKLP